MKLTEFELDVMQLYWDRGEVSSSDICKQVMQDKGVAVNTVKTIIARLEDKGALVRLRQEGKTFVFKAAVSQEEISTSLLPTFMRRLFGNSPRRLIAHLIAEKQLSKKDAEHLQRLLQNYTDQNK